MHHSHLTLHGESLPVIQEAVSDRAVLDPPAKIYHEQRVRMCRDHVTMIGVGG